MLEFVNPWLLWGVLLGAVPVVIHFLQRQTWQEVDWGAMLFLQAAVKQRQRQSRVESLLLLSVRCLIPILAALALAQPIVSGLSGATAARSPRHWMFVIDRTASMQAVANGSSRFDVARNAILRTLDQARPGDSFSLFGISSVSDPEIVGQPTRDREEFARIVRGLEPTLEDSGGLAILARLNERLADEPPGRQVRVIILSDFPQTDWGGSTRATGQIQELLSDLASRADISLVDVAVEAVDNVGVVNLRVESMSPQPADEESQASSADPEANESTPQVMTTVLDELESPAPSRPPALLIAGRPAMISFTLWRDAPATGTESAAQDAVQRDVQVLVEGREIHGSSMSIPAGKQLQVLVPWTPARPGMHRVSIKLSADGFTADDERQCVIHVEDRVSVLIIDGAPHVPASRFVKLALDPWQEEGGAQPTSGPPLDVFTAGIERLLQGNLDGFDVVVLCDVPLLSELDVSRLAKFVESGGALILGMGEAIDHEGYARWAFSADGLCELDVGDIVGDADHLEEPYQVIVNRPEHPALSRFAAHPRAGLQTSRLHRYLSLSIPAASTAEAVLSLNTGDPLLIEQRLGRGRCLIVTTALDDRWGSWVLWPSFVPLMNELVTYVASGKLEEQSLQVGDVYRRWLPDESHQNDWTVEGPGDRPLQMQSVFGSRGMQAEIGPLLLPGSYSIHGDSADEEVEHLAVNIAPEENEAAKADLEAIGNISARVHAHTVQSWQARSQDSADVEEVESLLARRLLAVVLCLLLIEPILARRFRAGVILLLAMSVTIVGQFVITLLR